MDQQIAIYVINMAQDMDRMASMARQLTQQGLAFERVEAVVGRELTPAQRKSSYSPFWFGLLQGRRISDGELGCALSHRKIYHLMLDRGQNCAVILEDDVKLMPQFARDLRKIEVETREFDMVHLFAFRDADTFHHVARGFNVMTYAGPSSSAAAYLLRHSGAKKLMSLPNISFYSIKVLPEFWQKVSLFNPVVYLVGGFRWSFFEVADVSVAVSLCMRLFFLALCLAVIAWIFRTRYRFKN